MTHITRAAVLTGSLLLSACGGPAPAGPSPTPPAAVPTPPAPPGATATTQSMLSGLEDYIAWQLRELQDSLPRNPHNATQIQAKIALLQRPTLPAEVRDGRLFVEGRMTSISGAMVPVSAVFPLEAMRGEASEGVRLIEAVGPILEGFLATPFPSGSVRLWYGFKVGNSGGGGVLYMEDKGSYESRPGDKVPYDPIYSHELAHTYIGHESLTQLLETFAHNVARTGSMNVETWPYQRNCLPDRASNEGVCALLDVYRLIGRDAMSRAYQTVHSLRPPYGQPLSAACKQAFVNESPEPAKPAVTDKMAKVIY